MPDTTEVQEQKPKPTPPTYDIASERNGITLSTETKEIIPFMRLKGKKANTFYPAIDLNLENKDKIFAWIGDSNLINIVRKALKAAGQSIASNSVNAEGIFDNTLYAKYLTQFTSTGLKLSEINDLIDELQAELTQLIDKGEWATNDIIKAEVMRLNSDIRSYRQMRDDKQRDTKDEDENVPSVAA